MENNEITVKNFNVVIAKENNETVWAFVNDGIVIQTYPLCWRSAATNFVKQRGYENFTFNNEDPRQFRLNRHIRETLGIHEDVNLDFGFTATHIDENGMVTRVA